MNHTHARKTCSSVLAFFLLPAAFLAACGDPEIEEHTVPKGVESTPESGPETPPMPARTDPSASVPPASGVSADANPWSAPGTWRADPGERPMRLATYLIPAEAEPVEVAITRFPGDVGGMLANVNRWRSQIGLPPVAEPDLEGAIERHENPGFEVSLMHLEGPETHMLAASIYEPDADRTWFVRVTDTPELIATVRDEVFAFARTFGASD